MISADALTNNTSFFIEIMDFITSKVAMVSLITHCQDFDLLRNVNVYAGN